MDNLPLLACRRGPATGPDGQQLECCGASTVNTVDDQIYRARRNAHLFTLGFKSIPRAFMRPNGRQFPKLCGAHRLE